MSNLYKKFFLAGFLVLIFSISGFIGAQSAHAGQTTLSGWAWSPNVGWISFNSTDSGAGGGPYAVTISTTTDPVTGHITGTLGGYAWSSVGWIKFGGLSGFPSGGSTSDNAKIDFVTGAVTGWARACSGTINGTDAYLGYNNYPTHMPTGPAGDCSTNTSRPDGWDGWISLSGPSNSLWSSPDASGYQGTSTKGVTLNTTTGALTGFAWGSNVIGWVSFGASTGVGGSLGGVCVADESCECTVTCPTPNSPDFTANGGSAVFSSNTYGNVATSDVQLSGGASGSQTITVTMGSASIPGVGLSFSGGTGCVINAATPTDACGTVTAAITDPTLTVAGLYSIPITATRSDGAVRTTSVNLTVPSGENPVGNVSLWIVPTLPGGAPDTVNKKTSVTVQENEPVNLAWGIGNVVSGSCSGLSSGTNDPTAFSAWNGSIPDSEDSNSPYPITNLTKGQYVLQVQCTDATSNARVNSQTVNIQVIKSTETEF